MMPPNVFKTTSSTSQVPIFIKSCTLSITALKKKDQKKTSQKITFFLVNIRGKRKPNGIKASILPKKFRENEKFFATAGFLQSIVS